MRPLFLNSFFIQRFFEELDLTAQRLRRDMQLLARAHDPTACAATQK